MPVVPALGPPPGRGPDVDTTALWLEFRGRLRAFVARRISDGADVDDTVQWVFLRLHESQAGLERTDRVHAWLYRTARRAIADYYRTKTRRREVPSGHASDLEALAKAPGESGETAAADLRQAAECLAPLVEDLPPPYREAVVLADLRGVRLVDAARSAGVSLSGMKSRVQRGRRRLKRLLLDCCRLALDGGNAVTACEVRRRSSDCCGRPRDQVESPR